MLVASTSLFKVSLISPNSTSSLRTYFAVLVPQSCLTLWDATDCSPPGSSVHVSRQEYWSGLPFPSPWTLPDPRTEPGSPALQADSFTIWATGEAPIFIWKWKSIGRVRLYDPTDHTVHGILQAGILEWVAFPLLHGIFPTQGSKPGVPHCRWIPYQLSHCRH